MRLKLNRIAVDCVIGELEEERNRLQRLVVDVELEIPELVCETDELTDTVDYPTLAAEIRRTLIEGRCKMIERAAYLACAACFKVGGSSVLAAKVSVTKEGAIENLASATAVYERTRGE